MKEYTKVLTIAGIETLGSAGIGADFKSIAANGCFGVVAMTSVVNETPGEIKSIYHLPVEFVLSQIDSVLGGLEVQAIKTGMLHSEELINGIYHTLKKYELPPLVIDPVMVNSDNIQLVSGEAVKAFKEKLFTIADVITPNLREGEKLLNCKISSVSEMKEAVVELACTYNTSVIMKSGHFNKGTNTDVFYDLESENTHVFNVDYIDTENVNGTGDTLSASIACFLARGECVRDAVMHAKEYVHKAIISGAGFEFGKGFGPVNHFAEGAPKQFLLKTNVLKNI